MPRLVQYRPLPVGGSSLGDLVGSLDTILRDLLSALTTGAPALGSVTMQGIFSMFDTTPNTSVMRFYRTDGVLFMTLTPGHDTIGVGSNVSLDMQNRLPATAGVGRTGFDLLPTTGTLPTTQALTEIVMYRTTDKATNYERLNIFSGMANPSDGGWRLGQEFSGTGVRRDIVLAQENGVTAGTEVYLRIAARDGDSQRLQVENGHLRFDVADRGGLATAYWIGRGGGSTMNYNVPTGAIHQFLVNNAVGIELGPGFIQGTEITAPAAGAANTGRLFLQDNGSGKTQLAVIFNTGAAQIIATEP